MSCISSGSWRYLSRVEIREAYPHATVPILAAVVWFPKTPASEEQEPGSWNAVFTLHEDGTVCLPMVDLPLEDLKNHVVPMLEEVWTTHQPNKKLEEKSGA